MESKIFVDIVHELYPHFIIYENTVPQNFKRPSFMVVKQDLLTETQQLTRFVYKEVKTFYIYAFVDKDNLSEVKEVVLNALMGKKLLIPGTDNRYLTVESIQARTKHDEFIVEFAVKASRTVNGTPRTDDQKINQIISNVGIKE